jgi:hypothetical protein
LLIQHAHLMKQALGSHVGADHAVWVSPTQATGATRIPTAHGPLVPLASPPHTGHWCRTWATGAAHGLLVSIAFQSCQTRKTTCEPRKHWFKVGSTCVCTCSSS